MIKRLVVAGGGTGGHLFPGLAVVEALRQRNPELSVTFVGTARGIEARVLPKAGEHLELLSVSPLKGMDTKAVVHALSQLPFAATAALGILRREKPDLVLGVGGYASGPALSAACALQIPTAVLEQNAHVGMTNRLLAPVVGRAYVSFETTASVFPAAAARLSGNPLRAQILELSKQAHCDPDGFDAKGDTILILGGSQGSRTLNETVPSTLARLLAERGGALKKGWKVVHQVGSIEDARFDAIARTYQDAGIQAEVTPFIDDMASAYRRAGLVVARAGASTVAELSAIGRPSILVPFPHAADDHQRINAEALSKKGAAVCILEDDLEQLGAAVKQLLFDGEARKKMARQARALGRPDAAEAIVDDLLSWLDPTAPSARTLGSASLSAASRGLADGQGVSGKSSESSLRSGLRGERPYVPRTRLRRCAMSPERRFSLDAAAFVFDAAG